MGFANIEELVVEKDYDAIKDKLVFDGDGDFFVLSSGYFAILFPQDAHMPQVALEKPEQVRKWSSR